LAKQLGLNVIGVSFHVGSGCGDAGAYTTALNDALEVFAYGEKIGMNPMTVIDIGGGFPGDTGGYGGPGMPTFQNLAQTIRSGIVHFNENLPSPRKVRFIAEPGRYFVSAAVTIVTKVYARKGGISNVQALYCDDGVYGSFNNVVYDHAHPVPRKLSHLVRELQGFENTANEEQLPTAVFGPTCDGLDQMCSMETTSLPRCETGDWLIFENMGAYTHTASFIFNGYSHFPNKVHCIV
jgi:ornithine decarboxylase